MDGGQNWAKFENNMPPVAIHYMAIHKGEDALIMATHGRGIIIIDDIAPIRQITETMLEKELHFLTNKATIINENSGAQGYATVGEYVGPNPSSAAKIMYFMNKRHTFGKMSMEVLDKDGKVVSDLIPGKSKGINEVEWTYSLKAPKVAKAKTFTFGGFAGPQLPAGVYTVKINKGSKEFTTKVVLKTDPNSIHTDADRTVKHEKSMMLYNMTETLAYEVDKLDDLQQMAESIVQSEMNKKVIKKLGVEAYVKEIESLRKELVVTSGDNYVGAAEPQLREKISTLYGEVIGYSGRPTNAQLANLELLNSKLDAAKVKVSALVKKSVMLNTQLQKMKSTQMFKVKTWEDFKKLD